MKKFNKIFRTLFFTGFVLVFIWVSLNLFFGSQIRDLFDGEEDMSYIEREELVVVYPDDMIEINPFSSSLVVRQRLINIYEPLLKQDQNLNLVPALAVSWGVIDDLTWEFHLRPGVEFHDGNEFDADDVEASINMAKNSPKSEMADLVNDIDNIELIDDYSLRIVTKHPDPLLLNKLALLPIVSSNYLVEDMIPVGTGPYEFLSWEKGKELVLESNSSYWGKRPEFQTLKLVTRSDKSARVNEFLNRGEVLTFVPFDAVDVLKDKGVEMISIPTLEVQFLVFNRKSNLLGDSLARKAIFSSVNRDDFVSKIGSFAKTIDQYVSDGVFGYSSGLEGSSYSLESAKQLVTEAALEGETLKLNLPVGMDILGEQLRNDFKSVGIDLIVSYFEVPDLLESMEKGDADIYFLGFKSTLGDAAEFFESVVKTDGDFNIGGYSNPKADYLIDIALSEFDPRVRLESLKEAMEIIVNEDLIGIPLFEYEKVYAFADGVDWDRRVDGLIYPDELEIN